MREQKEPELSPAAAEPALLFEDLALTAPILAGKLARLPPEQLAMVFPPENSVGPV
ncbi:hypothetical protein LN996_04305 [Arthrobacter sp. AK01]|uniref:hypothetical protein n=1 Tax=Micrococcaceae TaxID=1268 RepID=UPI001E3297F6|nr:MULTISPECIES: hypothetical protein [Micrococcaceae]MCD4850027.1 hypothetical protein [Arthrobacter sp. AK01]MCP1413537.1 hypothetical protein [Paenarthrobacter sp. A20]